MSTGKATFVIITALAIVLVLTPVLAACGSPEPTTAVMIATSASTLTEEVVATDTPVPDTPAPTPTPPPPADSPVPSTLTPTPELPTNTPAADTATPLPPASDTPVPNTPTPAPTKPRPTPTVSNPPPTLLAPLEKDAGSLRGAVTFRWSYPRPLNQNEAFQVLIWKEGDPHWGAAELWSETEQTIDLDGVLPQRAGTGEYLWTVVVREKGSEKVLSPEASPWRLNYLGDPCAACDCNSQCRQNNCESCCDACCGGCQ
jgi:hypothetical protein